MSTVNKRALRIGCASAFWGDTNSAAAQLVQKGELDYLVFDYLAEITMSIMAAKRLKDPKGGYATDWIEHVMAPLLPEIARQKIKVVSNAGGINPLACAEALRTAASHAGVALKVAVVLGDDLALRRKEFADATEIETGAPLPPALLSMNAYLGAIPIAKALDAGADIVVTGRCVDSAVILGPLMHEFGWAATDYDKLAAGSLAGHIIECGTQCTGGNFTDWELVRAGFDDMGFPIVEVSPDGSFVVAKPDGTGGLVSVPAVCEQMLYEIGDPRAYVLPDVICDFTRVRMEQAGENRVRVSGAKGRAPTTQYKVSATYPAGYRCHATFMIGGIGAAKKGQAVAEAIIKRARRLFDEHKLGDYSDVSIDCLGAEATYGPHARDGARATREVIVKISVQHPNVKALKLFAREIAPAATAMAPGMTGFFGGRPDPSPVVKLFSCLVPKARVPVEIVMNGERIPVKIPDGQSLDELPPEEEVPPPPAGGGQGEGDMVTIPLIRLAFARSGDKGAHSNVGVIARKPEYLPYIEAALTPQAVAKYFAHLLRDGERGEVERWRLPGMHALNFLLHHSLAGGGVASLRADPQGKCHAQMLLDFPVPVPRRIAK